MAFEARIGALVDTARKAEATTGEPKRVIANISSSPRRMLELAAIAEQLGAAALLVNGYVNGFGSVQDLAEEVAGRLPIITCNIGIALLTRAGQPSGMSGAVLARLSRLAGADAVHTGASAADWHGLEGWGRTVLALRSDLRGVNPSIPVAAGGVNIGNAAHNIISMGQDLVLEAGGGIFGYPGGPARAGEAFRIVIDVIKPHTDVNDVTTALAQAGRKCKALSDGIAFYGMRA
jgi:ribulose-bisphosphate carboxylase large chain